MGGGFLDITFTVDGVTEVRQSFVTWGKAVEDLTPAWDDVGDDVRGDFMQNMIGEGALFAGGGWTELAPSTIAEKRRLGYGAMPILWRSGRLGNSLAIKGAEGNVNIVTPNGVTLGTDIPYAHWHQDGGEHLPMRKIVGLTWQRQQGVVKRLGDYVRDAARAAGLDAS
jgi:hypothetical protein